MILFRPCYIYTTTMLQLYLNHTNHNYTITLPQDDLQCIQNEKYDTFQCNKRRCQKYDILI